MRERAVLDEQRWLLRHQLQEAIQHVLINANTDTSTDTNTDTNTKSCICGATACRLGSNNCNRYGGAVTRHTDFGWACVVVYGVCFL